MPQYFEQFTEWVRGLADNRYLLAAIVFATAFAANWIAKKLIVRAVRRLVAKTPVSWDDHLVEHKVFERLSHFAPAMVFYVWASLLFPDDSDWESTTRRLAVVYMVIAGGRTAAALLDALLSFFRSDQTTDRTALRSYIQVGKIVLWLVVGILAFAKLMDKDPQGLLTGLGALMTIILLVFKDSILGFVASIQLTRDDLIRRGDWIEVPSYGADGDVLEVTLHAVKVQNWDKTISTVPTPALVTGGFKNWRGMSESGGRRIKRSLNLDMHSVRFIDEELLARLKNVQYIQEYLDHKVGELGDWNRERAINEASLVNGRRLTNLGTFRAYVQSYLKNHAEIRQDMTFLVRQLEPSADGVPLQIYVFSKEQRWVPYEGIMGDIFDHLLAVLPEFDLRVFQRPSGADLRQLDLGAAR